MVDGTKLDSVDYDRDGLASAQPRAAACGTRS